MSHKIDPVIIKGTVMGHCPKCKEPYMGELDADSQDIQMTCVNCYYTQVYEYRWPDELPKVVMRNKKIRKDKDE